MYGDEVLKEYYDKINNLQADKQTLKEDSKYSQEYKDKQIKEIDNQARKEQEKYKQLYLDKLESETAKLKESIKTDIPTDLIETLKDDLTKQELQLLAEKHQDKYFALKKIKNTALKNDYAIEVDTIDYSKEIQQLNKAKEKVNDKFTYNPYDDTLDARLRKSMGL
jgi:hypothetical protein